MEAVLLLVLLAGLWLLWRWVCRQCEVANEVDWGNRWLNRLDGLNRLFCRRYHRLRCTPIGLPEKGAAIVASNHVSGLDPLLMAAAARRPLRFMIAREQYQRFGLTWLFKAIGCIPVERHRQPERALREALHVLQRGEVVALFPHGGIRLESDSPRKIKGGVAKLAQITHCPIYPVHITGVRGQGYVLLALILRSRARVIGFEPLSCMDDSHDCLQILARLLECGQIVNNKG